MSAVLDWQTSSFWQAQLAKADVSWRPTLRLGLQAMHSQFPHYLSELAASSVQVLPTEHRIFAAFAQPISKVRYVLMGEGPYPRAESATGVCFMDGAVTSLWSETGLSSKVNRATSLRNIMKMLLVAEGWLDEKQTDKSAMQDALQNARKAGTQFIQTLLDLQHRLHEQGFLLLNASLVFRTSVAPAIDAKAWLPMMREVFRALHGYQVDHKSAPAQLILWGKIAAFLQQIPETVLFPQHLAEHPYNLSFVQNRAMQDLFRPMHLLMCDTI